MEHYPHFMDEEAETKNVMICLRSLGQEGTTTAGLEPRFVRLGALFFFTIFFPLSLSFIVGTILSVPQTFDLIITRSLHFKAALSPFYREEIGEVTLSPRWFQSLRSLLWSFLCSDPNNLLVKLYISR